MADASDVCNALVAVINGLLYPMTPAPGANSTLGMPVRVGFGWPTPQQLKRDIDNHGCNVGVYPRDEERNTTRYQPDFQTVSVAAPTLSLSSSGNTITVGGSPGGNQNVCAVVNALAFTYAAQATDTLATIATALAALINAAIAGTTAAGPVITLPPSARIQATRIGVQGTIARETGRQQKLFGIVIWADSPTNRDAIGKALDVLLKNTDFLTFPDSSSGRLLYQRTAFTDMLEKTGIFRRDHFYTCDFPTVETLTATQVTSITTTVEVANPDGSQTTVATFTD